jgi:hypothetical protein
MTSPQLIDFGSIEPGGAQTVTIGVAPQTPRLNVRVCAKFTSQDHSGLAAAFEYSDDGEAFQPSAVSRATIVPTSFASGFHRGQHAVSPGITDGTTRVDGGTIAAYRVRLTNTDAASVACFAVEVW